MIFNRDITTHATSRRLPSLASGALRQFVLACVLLFVAMILTPFKAEAHVLHAPGLLAETTVDAGEGAAGLTAETDGCETFCCSPAACASALLSVSGQTRGQVILAARYALPADERADAHPQTALKRPPRS